MLKNHEEIKTKVSNFTYFDDWDEATIDALCNVSKLKSFSPDQIVLGGQFDHKSYVYFITSGICRIIECLHLRKSVKNNREIYRLATEEENKHTKTYLMNVCILNRLSCFNIGENLKNRQIVAITNTECLLIPYYWLLEHNEANIWMRIQQFLCWKIPKTEQIFHNFVEERNWREHKNKLIKRKMKRKFVKMGLHNVPYALKV